MNKLNAALMIALDTGDYQETQQAIGILMQDCRTNDGGRESIAETAARLLAEAYVDLDKHCAEMKQHVTRHMCASVASDKRIADLEAENKHLRATASPDAPSVPIPDNPRYVIRRYGARGKWGIMDRLTLSWTHVLDSKADCEAVFYAYRCEEMPSHCLPYSAKRENDIRACRHDNDHLPHGGLPETTGGNRVAVGDAARCEPNEQAR